MALENVSRTNFFQKLRQLKDLETRQKATARVIADLEWKIESRKHLSELDLEDQLAESKRILDETNRKIEQLHAQLGKGDSWTDSIH